LKRAAKAPEEILMAVEKPMPIEKMVFRKTNSHLGRSLCVTPSNRANHHLRYA